MTTIRHLCFLALVVMGSLGAIRGPATFEPDAYRPPAGMVLFSPGPVGPAVLVPRAFAEGSIAIADCEDRARQGWDAVGDDGHSFGPLQVNDQHREAMARRGWDFSQESDRIRMAVILWAERGGNFQAWSCFRGP